MSKLKVNEIAPFSGSAIGIGGPSSEPSALVDMQSTSQAFYAPRMTEEQRDAIASPKDGALVYNTDAKSLDQYNAATSSWESVVGVQSINGRTAKAQFLDTGSDGTAPNFEPSDNDTNTLNIPLAATDGVTAGLISNSQYDSFDIRLFPPKNVLRVIKNTALGSQDFSSIGAALASITDNSSSNLYAIIVAPGIYSESPLTLKPYVSIVAQVDHTVVIQPLNNSVDFLTASDNALLLGCHITGPIGIGTATLRVSNAPTSLLVERCTFVGGVEQIVLDGATAGVNFELVSCQLQSTNDTVRAMRMASSVNALVVSIEDTNIQGGGTAYIEAVLIQGTQATLRMNGVRLEGDGAGNGVRIFDGARLTSSSGFACSLFDKGLVGDNTGSAPLIEMSTVRFAENATKDIQLLHPTTTGAIMGQAAFSKTEVDADQGLITMMTSDPEVPGILINGQINFAEQRIDDAVDISQIIMPGHAMGVMSGGALSAGVGLNVSVASGFGYLMVTGFPNHSSKKVIWTASSVAVPANTTSYIFFNTSGILTAASTASMTGFSILLGRVVTDASSVIFVEKAPMNSHHHPNLAERMLREAVGPVFNSGSLVAEGSSARTLNVTSGLYYFGASRFTPAGASPITFDAFYRSATPGVFTRVTGQTVVSNTQYDDGSGTLASIPLLEYAKHLLIMVGGPSEKYMLVYAQATHTTQGNAEQGDLPSVPTFVGDSFVRIASVIVRQGTSNIVAVIDERPRIGSLATASTGVTDHGALSGLADDDHTQYLLTAGTRAMAGNLNMGGNSITNVNQVDGVDVSAHAARHLPNGSDPIDTDPAVSISDSTNDEGIANALARADHVHAHGNRGGGSLHANATQSIAGFLSAADKTKLDNFVSDPLSTFLIDEPFALASLLTNRIGSYCWANDTGGTGSAAALLAGVAGHPGIVRLTGGTNASSTAVLHLSDGTIHTMVLGSGEILFRAKFRITGTLSQHARTMIGLGDVLSAAGDQANGVYVRIEAADTQWQIVSASGGVRSVSSTGVTFASGTWVDIGFLVNATKTSIQPLVNGVATGTPITTNISAAAMSPFMKTDAVGGGVATPFDVDHYYLRQILT